MDKNRYLQKGIKKKKKESAPEMGPFYSK